MPACIAASLPAPLDIRELHSTPYPANALVMLVCNRMIPRCISVVGSVSKLSSSSAATFLNRTQCLRYFQNYYQSTFKILTFRQSRVEESFLSDYYNRK